MILHRVIILFQNEYEGYHMYIPDLILFLYSKSCNTPCRQLHSNVEYNTCTNKGTIAWYSSFLPISVKLAVIWFPAYLVVWLMNVPIKGVLIGRFLSIFFSNSKEQKNKIIFHCLLWRKLACFIIEIPLEQSFRPLNYFDMKFQGDTASTAYST